MSEPSPNRIFSEDEVGRILKKASEMQGDSRGKTSIGLSMAELEQLAQEADIDPRFIAAAALQVTGGGEEDESNLFGGPLTLTLRRRIEGQVSSDTWERMISQARQRAGMSGETQERGKTREWTTDTWEGSRGSLTLHQREDHAELEVQWTESTLAIPFVIVPVLASVISLPIIFASLNLSGLAGTGLWFLVVALVGGLARMAFGTLAKSRRRKAREYADGLVSMAEEERVHAMIAADAPSSSHVADSPNSESRAEVEEGLSGEDKGQASQIPLDAESNPSESSDVPGRLRNRA